MKGPAAPVQAPGWLTSSSTLAATPASVTAPAPRQQPWPTPQDYNEALQNLALNCADPDLRGGAPELTPLGLPRAITGGFASVYRVRDGRHDWAVRCFLRDVPDQAARYAAIGRHLASANLPYTIRFDFLPTGVRIRGQWRPMLKMEWVAGETLDCWIARQLGEPAALRQLADRWLALLGALRRAGVAHGDLQHGNVLVAGDYLRLIDYDGMFVPGLAGRPGTEAGQRNYQHPRRGETDFGPRLDHFSGWVIYLALLALSIEPGLWQRCGGGDEALLLRRADFDQPAASATLAALATVPDRQLQALLPRFRSLLDREVADLPPVDDMVAQITRPHVPTLIRRPAPAKPAAIAGAAGWLPDHLSPPPPVALTVKSCVDRRALAGAATFAVLLTVLTTGGLLAPLLSALAIALLATMALLALLTRYLVLPATRRKLRATAASKRAAFQLRWAERTHASTARRAARRAATAEHAHATLAAARKACAARERAALTALDQHLARFTAQQTALEAAQATEADQAVQALRHRLLASTLAAHTIAAADIRGVGAQTKLRLIKAGVRTAGDIVALRAATAGDSLEVVTPDRGVLLIPGIGRKKADALRVWRQALETQPGITLPSALPPAEDAAHRQRYQARRQTLARQEAQAVSRAARQRAAIQRRHHDEQQALAARSAATRGQAKQERQASAAVLQQHTERVATARLRLALAERDRAAYTSVTFGHFLRLVFGVG